MRGYDMQIQFSGDTSTVPRASTFAALLTELCTARHKYADNRNLLRTLHLEATRLFVEAPEYDAMELYARAVIVAVLAVRLMEEGDASLPSYRPPIYDDIITRFLPPEG